MGYNSSDEYEATFFVQVLEDGMWLPHAGPMSEREADREVAAVAEKWGVRMRVSQTPHPEPEHG